MQIRPGYEPGLKCEVRNLKTITNKIISKKGVKHNDKHSKQQRAVS